jgi:excisionase family DNA binding protein
MIRKEVVEDLEVQENSSSSNSSSKIEVPIWHKINLTIEEAAAYSNIGEKKIRELLENPTCEFVLRKGTHKLVKRKQFEDFLTNQVVI